jgi:hypothetical protein
VSQKRGRLDRTDDTPGPWFCSLLFNTSEECKKQTHLISHTLPHLAVDVLNKPPTVGSEEKKRSRETEENCWVMILKVGPFEKWAHSVAFLNLWTEKTRGKMRRLERGLDLFHMYKNAYKLKLWAQPASRDACLQSFYHPPLPAETTLSNVASESNETFLEEGEMEVSEQKAIGMSLEEMQLVFAPAGPMDGTIVKQIKEVHQKLEASKRKQKRIKIKQEPVLV